MSTPLWLSGSLRPFLYSSAYSCHLFLIFFASVRSYHFCVLSCLSLHEIFPVSNFLKEISSVPIRLFSFLCILHLRRPSYLSLLFSGILHLIEYIFPFLPCLSLPFFIHLFVKPRQINTLSSCINFSWGWFWSLPPVQCYEPLSIILQALYLPDLIP